MVNGFGCNTPATTASTFECPKEARNVSSEGRLAWRGGNVCVIGTVANRTALKPRQVNAIALFFSTATATATTRSAARRSRSPTPSTLALKAFVAATSSETWPAWHDGIFLRKVV